MNPTHRTLILIREASERSGKDLSTATMLSQLAEQERRNGRLSAAREHAADAGDFLMRVIGTADPIAPLEESLWEGQDDAWQEFLRSRNSVNPGTCKQNAGDP